ncbi:phytanoyl-CoA dioxygenase family protein, partial [Planktotalea sp.]|uniref:phytanoyl-CoA dioxygenase family protein n=1 Tax=Planktotalea sp. TaxID=2029877 RepID=UPI003299233A
PLTSFCDATLGQDHIINCFTCVISKPGATQQHTHTDFSGLFGTPLDMFAPSYAINLFIPLVPLNDINGTTQMWPGTHKKPLASPEEHDGILPNVPLGSAVLMDYRVQHRGTANLSDEMRPILTIAYSRRWFIDTSNFATVAPLDLSQEQFETMDDRRIALFERAKLYF